MVSKILRFSLIFLLVPLTIFSQNHRKATSLFNGKDLRQWQMGEGETGFRAENGLLVTTVQNGANIFTKETFGNFILRLDYLLSKVGNSGIMIRSDPANAWATGVEVQLLAPWTPYRDDLHCTGSLYGHVAVTNRPDETTGIWHRMEIECDREYIRVSVDGAMTTEVRIDTVESLNSMYMEGSVGIQSNHSHETEFAHFRNIEIIDLDQNIDYVIEGFRSESPRVRKQAYSAAARLGDEAVPDLLSLLRSDDPMLQKGSRQALSDIVASVTNPGAGSKDLRKTKKAFKKGIKKASAPWEKDFMVNLFYILEGK